MSSEWATKRLGDCCEKIGSGATPKGGKEAYLDFGPVHLIRSQNVHNDGFSPTGLAYISEEQAQKLDNVKVESGDVLLNITGDSVARVCQALNRFLPARVNQHVAIIRPIPSVFDARYSLCCTLEDAKGLRDEVAFMQAVKVILTKREVSKQRKTDEERDLAIRQIISSAVVSGEVVDIFAAVGLDKPNIGLLDADFLAQVHNLPEKNLAVELLERLLQGEIKSRFASNVVQDKKFSDMLASVIQRYQNRSIETAQVMEELIAMAKKFREAASRGDQLGLREDEVKFYDALANNESAVRELQDETLKKIAQELTQNLRENLTVDWSERESVRAKLRLMVKRILKKYKYPPDQADNAVQLVLEQAEALGEVWS